MASHGPVSAAVLLCVAYAGLAVLNNISLKRRPSWDYTELTVFCWVRVVAFACEAAASHRPDRLRNALFEGFYDGGFFLLLVVLYGALRKWLEEAHNHTYLPFSNLSQATKGKLQTSYTIMCWCMPILSALGIGAAVASLSGHADSASDALHDTSGAGFLVVLAFYFAASSVVMINVFRSRMAVTAECIKELAPLVLVALLLMLKVCFQLACTTYTDAWVNPSLFYPLSALPEILAVIILCRHSLLPIITQGRLGSGSTSAGPGSHINPTAGGTDAQTAFSNGYGSSHSQHAPSPLQSFGGGFFPGTQSEGYSQQPYQQEQGYPALPYQHTGQEQGHVEEPYQLHRQGSSLQRPHDRQLGVANQRAPLHGQHAQHGQIAQHGQRGQRAQHGSSQHAGAQWQGMPQSASPQQLTGTLTQNSLPFQHGRAPSQPGTLPFQNGRVPSQPRPLPFQPSGLPSEPAPAAHHLGPLYPPYFPNHDHEQQPPSFFHNQHP